MTYLHKQENRRNHELTAAQLYQLYRAKCEKLPKCSNVQFDFEQNHLTKDNQHQDEQKPPLKLF